LNYTKLHQQSKARATKAIGKQYSCTIVIQGTDAKIEGTFPVQPILDATSYLQPGYRFTAQYRSKQWDGRIKLFKQVTRTFPAGLTQIVLKALRKEQVQVQVDDQRNCPGQPQPVSGLSLQGVRFDYPFDYQPECAQALVAARRGVAAVATNGGKTVISALVIKMLRLPTLFMVPNLELLRQTSKMFRAYLGLQPNDSRDVGVVGDGAWNPGRWVTVATVDTLYARIGKDECRNFLKSVKVVFADECHHVASDSWYQVMRFCDAYYRFGLSGTPLKRSDGADLRLIGVTGPVAHTVRNKELIDRGISVQPTIQVHKITKPVIAKRTKWQEVYQLGIVENTWRNTKLCLLTAELVNQGLSVLMLVKEIKHGEILDAKLWQSPQQGFIPHQFINGQETSEVRQKALDDFRKGELKVIIATSILDEGVDIPNIDALVLAGGGKSSIRTLQRVGRGLRKGGNVDHLTVIDTADFTHPYLTRHSMKRLHDYRAEECFKIEIGK
jgi:superfamily II DNA or RNA helicase